MGLLCQRHLRMIRMNQIFLLFLVDTGDVLVYYISNM